MKYKKYIVFQFYAEYPSGGLGDITGNFDSIEEAKEFIKEDRLEYNEIIDRDTWEEIEINS